MKRVPTIVICSCLLLLMGSCGRGDPRADLNSYLSGVPDETRSAELRSLSGQLDESLASHRQLLRESRARLRSLNADYDATEDTLRQQWLRDRAKLRASQETIVGLFVQMRERSSREEWKRISRWQSQQSHLMTGKE